MYCCIYYNIKSSLCQGYIKTKSPNDDFIRDFLLYSQRKQDIKNQKRCADDAYCNEHRKYHSFYALNVSLPYCLRSCRRAIVGLLSYRLSACTRHIDDSRAVVIVHNLWLFLFIFLIAHNYFSSKWQAAKWPGSYSLY